MSVAAQCDSCGKKYQLDDRFAGKRAKCRDCGAVFSVPAAAQPTPPKPAARTAPTRRPPVAADPGEIDFSGLEDVETTGKIDPGFRVVDVSPPAPAPERPRGSPLPAHLRPEAALRAAEARRSGKPKVGLFLFAGCALFALVCFGIYKLTGGARDTAPAVFRPPPRKDDGEGLTAEKYLANINARRQAEKDAVPPQPVEKLALPVRTTFPDLGDPSVTGPIVTYHVTLSEPNLGEPMGVSLMAPSGAAVNHSLPCVLLAPTMTEPLEGETSIEADFDEAAQIATAGFAVALYDTSRFSFNIRPQKVGACVGEFMQSQGGLHFARNAINLVFAKAVMVDPKRVYSVGYGSAASVAINLAVSDPRVRGVAVQSPVCDIPAYLAKPPGGLEAAYRIQGVDAFAARISPISRVPDLHCPILVMTMEAPSRGGAEAFVAALKAAGKPVTHVTLKASESGIDARGLRVKQLTEWLKGQ